MNLKSVMWVVLSLLLMGWTTYQLILWWEYKVGLRVVGTVVQQPEAPRVYMAIQKSYEEQYTGKVLLPVNQVPEQSVVCSQEQINTIHKAINEYQSLLEAKPYLAGSGSEIEVHLQELQNNPCNR